MKKVIFIIFWLLIPLSTLVAGELPHIPEGVTYMYVFLQKPGELVMGSSEVVAEAIPPEEFLSDFQMYVNSAKKKNMKLIVTAETADGNWVQNQIIYRSKSLRTERYYNAGIKRISPGAEIPLD